MYKHKIGVALDKLVKNRDNYSRLVRLIGYSSVSYYRKEIPRNAAATWSGSCNWIVPGRDLIDEDDVEE